MSAVRRVTGVAAATLLVVLLPATALAAELPAQPRVPGADTVTTVAEAAEPAAAGLAVAVEAVMDGPSARDAVADPETGLPTVTLAPGRTEQVAVHRVTVTNTGDDVVRDVSVVDERAGVVLDAAAGTSLAPGESVEVEFETTYLLEEAISGTAGLVSSVIEADGVAEGGAEVGGSAESVVQVVAVLPSPGVEVAAAVVLDEGDVVAGPDGPTVTWSDEEAEAEATRTVVVRVEVTNSGDVDLVDLGAVVTVAGRTASAPFEGATLAPGEGAVDDVVMELAPGDVAAPDEEGTVEVDLLVRVEVTAADADAATALASADATLHAAVVRPVPEDIALPAAGAPRVVELLVLALLTVGLGVALLHVAPRRPGRTVWV